MRQTPGGAHSTYSPSRLSLICWGQAWFLFQSGEAEPLSNAAWVSTATGLQARAPGWHSCSLFCLLSLVVTPASIPVPDTRTPHMPSLPCLPAVASPAAPSRDTNSISPHSPACTWFLCSLALLAFLMSTPKMLSRQLICLGDKGCGA